MSLGISALDSDKGVLGEEIDLSLQEMEVRVNQMELSLLSKQSDKTITVTA